MAFVVLSVYPRARLAAASLFSLFLFPFSLQPSSVENLKAVMGVHLAYDIFVKTRSKIRCATAVASGVESSAWSVNDLTDAA